MRKRRLFPSLSLLAILLAACAPTTATVIPSETLPPSVSTSDASVQATAALTQNLATTPLPIVTSRGPNLEAIDPTTVSLASGGVQFVEFFRFT